MTPRPTRRQKEHRRDKAHKKAERAQKRQEDRKSTEETELAFCLRPLKAFGAFLYLVKRKQRPRCSVPQPLPKKGLRTPALSMARRLVTQISYSPKQKILMPAAPVKRGLGPEGGKKSL